MAKLAQTLERIAAALERLAPPAPTPADWLCAPAYVWDGARAQPIARIEAPELALLRGIDTQKALVTDNVARLAAGRPAHDMLLWGARGMGKSALLRASVAAAQTPHASAIALIQIAPDALATLATLFTSLAQVPRQFLVFIDDLGFEETDTAGPRALRSWLEGGVAAHPANLRLAVTSNRRAIVARHAAEQDDPLNPRDTVDDRLALADRFGLSIGFHNCSQDDYLAMITGYAAAAGLEWDEAEALAWAKRRGARSGRAAVHFLTEISGRIDLSKR